MGVAQLRSEGGEGGRWNSECGVRRSLIDRNQRGRVRAQPLPLHAARQAGFLQVESNFLARSWPQSRLSGNSFPQQTYPQWWQATRQQSKRPIDTLVKRVHFLWKP